MSDLPRKKRNRKPFTITVDEAMDLLSPNGKLVYWALNRCANNSTMKCHPGYDYLAEIIGFSISSVRRGMDELRSHGLVAVTPRYINPRKNARTSNEYTVFDEPQKPRNINQTSAHTEQTSAHTEQTSAPTELTSAHTEQTFAHTEQTFAHTEQTFAHTEQTFAHTEQGTRSFELNARELNGFELRERELEGGEAAALRASAQPPPQRSAQKTPVATSPSTAATDPQPQEKKTSPKPESAKPTLGHKNSKSKEREKKNQEEQKTYGQLKNVLLTDKLYADLIEMYTESTVLYYIDRLSLYMGSNGKEYYSHYATIVKWITEDDRVKAEKEAEKKAVEEKESKIPTPKFKKATPRPSRFANFTQRVNDNEKIERLEREYIKRQLECTDKITDEFDELTG